MVERDHGIGATVPGHYGAAGSGVAFARVLIAAAWNAQGDPADAAFTDAARHAFGVVLPAAPNTIAKADGFTAIWLGPASWLLVAGDASPLVEFTAKRDALDAAGGALFDVSAGRVAWTISGPLAATVLASGCPLDFHPRAFAPGTCAQSLFGRVGAIFVCHDATTFTILVARSFARDVWHAFCAAAAQYGYDVLPGAPLR